MLIMTILFRLNIAHLLQTLLLLGFVTSCDENSDNSLFDAKTNIDRGASDISQSEVPFDAAAGFSSGIVYKIVRSDSSNGAIYIGGTFTSYRSVSANRIIKLLPSGDVDTSFNVGSGFDGDVRDICIAKDGSGDLYVGGSFTTYKGANVASVVRLNSDGNLDSNFSTGSGFNDTVSRLLCSNFHNLIVVGSFTEYKSVNVNRIASLDSMGSINTAFDIGSGFNPRSSFYALEEDSAGNIYVGGKFNTYNSLAISNYAKLSANGSLDTAFTKASGFNSFVVAIEILSSGVVIGGTFTTFNGVESRLIVKLDNSGEIDLGFDVGAGFNTGGVFSLVSSTLENNVIYVAGSFTRYDGSSAPRIIALDSDSASKVNTFAPFSGANNTIWTLETSAKQDGSIYLGGAFTEFDGNAENRVIGLLPSGTKDE